MAKSKLLNESEVEAVLSIYNRSPEEATEEFNKLLEKSYSNALREAENKGYERAERRYDKWTQIMPYIWGVTIVALIISTITFFGVKESRGHEAQYQACSTGDTSRCLEAVQEQELSGEDSRVERAKFLKATYLLRTGKPLPPLDGGQIYGGFNLGQTNTGVVVTGNGTKITIERTP